MRSALTGVIAGLVFLMMVSSPVAAEEDLLPGEPPPLGFDELPPEDYEPWDVPLTLIEDALGMFFAEIALLVELEGFDGGNEHFDEIHDYLGPLMPDSHAELVHALEGLDLDLEQVKFDMFAYLDDGVALDGLDSIAPEQIDALDGGATGVVPSEGYLHSLTLLLTFGATDDPVWIDPFLLEMLLQDLADPADFTDPETEEIDQVVGAPAEAPPTTARPEPTDAPELGVVAPSSSGPDTDGFPWTVVAIAASAAGLVLALLLAFGRRRRSRSEVTEPVRATPDAGLADALRRLTKAGSEADVAEIATTEARAIVEGTHSVLVRPAKGGVRVASRNELITGSCLDRPISTGEAVLESVAHDPIAPAEQIEIVAIPTTADGQVVGVLAVWRAAGTPFTQDDRLRLAGLAPNVAVALKNVDRLDAATSLAMVDDLTSLGNRRRLDHDLDQALHTASNAGLPIAFAMVDVDHFKQFNDTHGHSAGDDALRVVAGVMAANVRPGDVVYRYGGEEFSILLPGATAEEAGAVVERVRRAVEAAAIPGQETQPGGNLTISVGIATGPRTTSHTLKEAADQALYGAKEHGRNRVVLG